MARGKRRREAQQWAQARRQAEQDRTRVLAEMQRAQDASFKGKSELYMLAGPVSLPATWEVYSGINGHQLLPNGNFAASGAYAYNDGQAINMNSLQEEAEDIGQDIGKTVRATATIRVHFDPGGFFVINQVDELGPRSFVEVEDAAPIEVVRRPGKRNLRP
jgi:hypothetical protein